MKAFGLRLVTVDGPDDWASWCRGADFRTDRLTFKSEVVVRPESPILIASNSTDITAICSLYGKRSFGHHLIATIDWPTIAVHYAGVVIAPYNWEHRLSLDSFWYYGWDCASGCIWDLSVLGAKESLVWKI